MGEIKPREVIASISIIAIMLLIGVIIHGKIEEAQLDANEKYNKAVKIESTDLFQYGMDTNIGNAFVYGDLLAVDTVTFEEIGGEYTIVVTSRYVPATKRDIKGTPIVIVLASTFAEYLYNHIFHEIRDIDYKDFDDIIVNNLGTDISQQISDLTLNKFATN